MNLIEKGQPTILSAQTYVQAGQSSSVSLTGVEGFCVAADITVSTPSNQTFVDGDVTVGTDLVNISGHGFETGLLVTLTSSGTLPTGS